MTNPTTPPSRKEPYTLTTIPALKDPFFDDNKIDKDDTLQMMLDSNIHEVKDNLFQS